MRKTSFAVAALWSTLAVASPSLVVAHTGRLLDGTDRPLAGPVSLHFELHTMQAALSGDQVVWQDSFDAVSLDPSGTYAVMLGDTTLPGGAGHTPLTPDEVSGDRWLAVTVNGTALSPWLRIGMAPAAARALDTDAIAGLSLADLDARYAPASGAAGYVQLSPAEPQSGDVTVDGTITAAHFAGGDATITGAVSATTLAGDGAGLTNLDASALARGTLDDARLSANVATLASSPTFTGPSGVTAPSFHGAFDGSGAGLTDLDAGALSTGTIADARLSANVARLDGAATFSGAVTAPSFVGGTFAGDGSRLTNLDPSQLQGGGNFVTLDGAQTVSGAKTFSGAVDVQNTASRFVGSVRLATDTTTACGPSSGNEGAVRWNGTTFEGCLATGWANLFGSPPVVTQVSPPGGAPAGGATFTVSGYGFLAPAHVFIGSAEATSVNVVSANQITAVAPSAAVGPHDVVVVNGDGRTGVLPNAFTAGVGRFFRLTIQNGTSGSTTVQVAELELFDGVTGQWILNDMTSANAPAPRVVTNTPTSYTNSAGWKIFDGAGPTSSYNDGYLTSAPGSQVTIDFGADHLYRVTRYRLWTSGYSDGGGTYRISSWSLDSSLDGSSWTTLDTRTNAGPASGSYVDFPTSLSP